MQAFSIISSRTFCIGRHLCYRCVYLLWLSFICTVLWRLIHFLQSIHAKFWIFRVQWTFLSEAFGLWKFAINDPLIHIWNTYLFLTFTFIMFIIGVACIKGWLFKELFSLLLKAILSWMWTSTLTAPWLRKIWSLIISYWIVQIQIINL